MESIALKTSPQRSNSEFVFEHYLPELLALRDSQIVLVNADVPHAITTALGVALHVKTLRPEIERLAKGANLHWIDNLQNYALALNYAHGEYLIAPQPRSAGGVLRAAQQLRVTLRSSARVWALRGVIPNALLQNFGKRTGLATLAKDLTLLVRIFRNCGLVLNEDSLPRESELKEAERLGAELVRLKHARKQRSPELQHAANLQARAFSLLLLAYDEARAAVRWVRRREGDADKIIPSLYKTRRNRRNKGAPAEVTGSVATLPVESVLDINPWP